MYLGTLYYYYILKRHKQAFKNTTTNRWFEIDVKSMWSRGCKNFLQSYRWLNLLVINILLFESNSPINGLPSCEQLNNRGRLFFSFFLHLFLRFQIVFLFSIIDSFGSNDLLLESRFYSSFDSIRNCLCIIDGNRLNFVFTVNFCTPNQIAHTHSISILYMYVYAYVLYINISHTWAHT